MIQKAEMPRTVWFGAFHRLVLAETATATAAAVRPGVVRLVDDRATHLVELGEFDDDHLIG